MTTVSLEQRIFFKLLERWVKRTAYKVEMPNGCLAMLPSLPYDVIIKSTHLMRRTKGEHLDD